MKTKYFILSLYSTPVRSTLRLAAALTWGLGLLGMALVGLLALPATETNAAGPDEGYVVVVFPGEDGTVRPISYTAGMSRIEALKLSGWAVEESGGSICSIDGIGCPASDCFCADNWWASAEWGADWDTSWPPTTVDDGDIIAFRWSQSSWGPPLLPGPAYTAASDGLDWLRSQQSATDGGYGSVGNSVEVMTTIGANGYQSTDWRRQPDAPSLFSHVLANGAAFSTNGASAAGKLAVGLSAGGGCYPLNALQPSDTYNAASGIYTGGYSAGGAGPQSWGILGEYALNQAAPGLAVTYLKSLINGDGGWGWESGDSDTNGTALAIQALIAAGEPLSSSTISNGLAYLKSTQNADGGFPYDPNSSYDTNSDANSTAYVVQAIMAAGQNPVTGTWIIAHTNPISYLLGMQQSDGGFAWQSGYGSDQFATRQAILALLGQALPIQSAEVATCYGGFLPIVVKN